MDTFFGRSTIICGACSSGKTYLIKQLYEKIAANAKLNPYILDVGNSGKYINGCILERVSDIFELIKNDDSPLVIIENYGLLMCEKLLSYCIKNNITVFITATTFNSVPYKLRQFCNVILSSKSSYIEYMASITSNMHVVEQISDKKQCYEIFKTTYSKILIQPDIYLSKRCNIKKNEVRVIDIN